MSIEIINSGQEESIVRIQCADGITVEFVRGDSIGEVEMIVCQDDKRLAVAAMPNNTFTQATGAILALMATDWSKWTTSEESHIRRIAGEGKE